MAVQGPNMPSKGVREGHDISLEAGPSVSSKADLKLPSSTIPEQPVASTSADTAPAPKAKRPRFQRPKPEYLKSLGIKIRDYAYIKTNLPPIKIVFRHPVQTQPAVHRTIQRSSTEPDASQENPLTRHDTEPVIGLTPTEPNLDDVDDATPMSQASSGSSVPDAILRSQASGELIYTPPVTPNGTLQWGAAANNYIPSTLSGVAGPSSQVSNTDGAVASASQHPIPTPTSPLTPLPSFYNSQTNLLNSPTPAVSRSQSFRFEVPRTNSIQQLRPQSSGYLTGGRYNLRKRPAPTPIVYKPKAAKRQKLTEALPKPFKPTLNLRKKATSNALLLRTTTTTQRSSKGKGKARSS